MEQPSSFLHVLAAFIVALGCAPAEAQTIVRVVHYNVHREINGTATNTPELLALAKIVNHLAPDVWTINELGWAGSSAASAANLAAFINARLTIFGPSPQAGQHYFVYVGQRTDGFIVNAIVSRHPLLATQTYSDEGGGYPALRGLVSAHVDLPGAVELGVFTAHLKASSLSDTVAESNANAQRRQAEAAADALNLSAWLGAHLGDAAIVTGDFNETEEPSDVDNWKGGPIGGTLPNGVVYHPITTLRAAGFADAGPVSIAGNRDTLDATSPDVRFDHVLHRGSHLIYLSGSVFDTKQHSAAQLAALNAANGTSFVAANSATASDHLPVLEVFLASPGPAYIAPQSATSLASTSATFNATINPNGSATTWRVEFGTTTAYGATSYSQTLPASTSNANVSFKVAGLAPATTYHFRIVSENGSGISVGADQTFTTAAFLDSDGDGLPNDWEAANGLNANSASDALLDADGDGARNRDEFAAGTGPRATADTFRITSVARTDGNLVVTWPSVLGKRYRLETRADLTVGTWSALGSSLTGTGAPLSATDSSGAAPRYYRVALQP